MTEVNRPALCILDKCKPILSSKAYDYSSNSDLHSNFKLAEALASEFPNPYKTYVVLIGMKLARISQLLQKGEVKHESLDDSFLDGINYLALMYERYKEEQKNV